MSPVVTVPTRPTGSDPSVSESSVSRGVDTAAANRSPWAPVPITEPRSGRPSRSNMTVQVRIVPGPAYVLDHRDRRLDRRPARADVVHRPGVATVVARTVGEHDGVVLGVEHADAVHEAGAAAGADALDHGGHGVGEVVAPGATEERETADHRDRRVGVATHGATGELRHRREAAVELDVIDVAHGDTRDLLHVADRRVERGHPVVRRPARAGRSARRPRPHRGGTPNGPPAPATSARSRCRSPGAPRPGSRTGWP